MCRMYIRSLAALYKKQLLTTNYLTTIYLTVYKQKIHNQKVEVSSTDVHSTLHVVCMCVYLLTVCERERVRSILPRK